jgi:hypothetical protein
VQTVPMSPPLSTPRATLAIAHPTSEPTSAEHRPRGSPVQSSVVAESQPAVVHLPEKQEFPVTPAQHSHYLKIACSIRRQTLH